MPPLLCNLFRNVVHLLVFLADRAPRNLCMVGALRQKVEGKVVPGECFLAPRM